MKAFRVVLIVILAVFGIAVQVSAQGSSCLLGAATTTTGPVFPTWWFDCNNILFLWICSYYPASCTPAAGAGETCPTCGSPTASTPISLASGNTYIDEADIRIPGLNGGLSLVRTWNSVWPATQTASQIGLFGPNWRSTYEERIFVGSDNYVKYARSDGSFWSFAGPNPLTVAAPANEVATLVYGPTNWTLTFKNGEQRVFNETSGNLVAIIDRNGNTTQLSYDAVNRLTTVTDPSSRTLTFTYQSPTSFLVTGVASSTGLSASYSYDTYGRLLQITEPDSSTLSFQYDSHSLITAVTDSQGKILESHTYDSAGRGLTGSRANGVDMVTLSYGNP